MLLVFAGCRKVDKVETYKVEIGEATVTTGSDEVSIEATYTYDYTLKSARLQYSDNSGLENAVSLAAQFDNGVLKATATGLKPATAYFYRFELDNGMTKMWTETGTFRTLDEPIVTELVVTTAEVSGIADTYAVCGGEVVSEGGSNVIARGVCYGLSENPSLDDCTGKTVDGGGLGTFTSVMTGLEKETKYYVRAYATDNDTTCYGEQKIFTTLGQIVYSLPTVITNTVDETTVGQYSAMLSGVVTDDGNKPVTGCGFWYSTSHDTLGGITKPAAYSTGGFSLNVSDGIEPGTTYYARAYAENELGRRLGNEVSFTTLSIPPTPDPQVFTLSSADVTTSSATIKGRIYYDGTENPIKKGFLYGTDINDMNSDIDCTSQPDPFEAALTGLTQNTTYYYKAYATFTGYAQTFYGGIESFTTLVEITEPTIHTVGPSNITTTTANSGGYGITDGNSPIVKKGVCWATFDNPTIDDCLGHTEDGTGTADFISEVTGLESGTSYYVRAYAKNQAGKTGYGEALGLHTMIMHQAPDVTTNQASGITGSSATVSGNVTNSYGCDITECWIIWGDSDNTMTNRLDCTAGTAFGGTLTDLTNEHTYSFQAFAKNEYDETGNGSIEHFTTNNETPDVETLDATETTANSATMNGRVNNNHGIGITECWFMWGTNADALTERVDCTPSLTFSGGVDGLQPNTNYYFVAYAKNNNGLVGNGTVNQLLTSPTLPTVTTSEITDITPTTATSGGNVTNDGGATVTARGICWSTSPNPTVSDPHTSNGTGTGIFTSSMTGLTPNTTYYVRAYATNSAGTAYGNPETFTTAQEETGSYFCITALDAGTTTVSMAKNSNAPTVHLEYKKNNGTWTAFTVGSTNISLSQNDKVFFKAPDGHTNNRFASGVSVNNYFVVQGGKVKVSGNIIYLLDPTGTLTTFTSTNDYAFLGLFSNCDKLEHAGELIMPVITFSKRCCQWMFKNCTSLITAPALPASTVDEFCYSGMFSGCSSLASAPAVQATTLARQSCYVMFENCTSLTYSPDLPDADLSNTHSCYNGMFEGCTSLTTAPALNATILGEYCYGRIFYGCTSLTVPPALPNMNLAHGCYNKMFFDCTSLVVAPELPATTLDVACYDMMFYGCTSLTTAPDLPATTLADYCYREMFEGCTSLHYIRMLATENLNAFEGLREWVSGVPSTGNFYKKAGANLPNGINGIPNGWTVHNE